MTTTTYKSSKSSVTIVPQLSDLKKHSVLGHQYKAQVEGGDYTNDSEYIRDLIRREQERGAEIEAVRAALIEGEKSGKPKRFNAGAFKRKLRRAHG